MYSFALFTFNVVALEALPIIGKPSTRAKNVCKALEYGEKSKTATIVKHLCSKENFAHEYQMRTEGFAKL